MSKHWEICEAPICAGDPNPNYKEEVIWYPGEEVCKKAPYQLFQKRQIKINKWLTRGEFKYPGFCFTANELETGTRITKGTRGVDPERDTTKVKSLKKKGLGGAARKTLPKGVVPNHLQKYLFRGNATK